VRGLPARWSSHPRSRGSEKSARILSRCRNRSAFAPRAAIQIAEYIKEGRQSSGNRPRRRIVSCSNDSLTKAAACRWFCMPRSADGSIVRGAWPCANDSAGALVSSFRRRPRRSDRHIVGSSAQLPAGGRVQLPAPDTVEKVLTQAVLRPADVRIAVAMERRPSSDPGALSERQARPADDSANARRRTCWRRSFPRRSHAPKTCQAATCPSPWIGRSYDRRSKTA